MEKKENGMDERMKETWRGNAGAGVGKVIEDAVAEAILKGERRTALQRLADRYRRFFIIGFVMVPLSVCWAFRPLYDGWIPVWLVVFMPCYFLAAALTDVTLWRRVRDIDVLEMPVAEVARRAMDCRRLHLQSVLWLLPCGLLFVGTMVWAFSSDVNMVVAVVLGFLFGLAIGLRELLLFMRDYRSLSE